MLLILLIINVPRLAFLQVWSLSFEGFDGASSFLLSLRNISSLQPLFHLLPTPGKETPAASTTTATECCSTAFAFVEKDIDWPLTTSQKPTHWEDPPAK